MFGTDVLIPTHVDWLLSGGDLSQHYLGWCFFRTSAWHFPYGLMDDLVWPDLVSVIYTDSIPLLAVPFKLLSPLLPAEFQYFGIWGVACYFLTAGNGALLAYRFCRDDFLSLCGAAFFAFSPYLLARMFSHTALSAHWLPLAAILLIVYRDVFPLGWRRWAAWGTLFFMACGIHLYFLPMLGIFLLADCAECLARERTWKNAARQMLLLGGCCALGLLHLLALGAFSGLTRGRYGEEGLGKYSSGLDTFFSSRGESRFLPALPFMTTSSEGFGYLGLGMLLLVACAAVAWLLRSRRVAWGLLGAGILHFLLALSPTVRLGTQVLFTIPLPEKIVNLLSIFRASGRFIWPVCYLLFLFALSGAALLPRRAAWALVSVCLIVQVFDLTLLQTRHQQVKQWETCTVTYAEGWQELAAGDYRHVVILSPEYPYAQMDKTYRVAAFAWRNGMTLSDFYLARNDSQAKTEEVEGYIEELLAGTPRADTVYILDMQQPDVPPAWGEGLNIRELDGVWVGTAKAP